MCRISCSSLSRRASTVASCRVPSNMRSVLWCLRNTESSIRLRSRTLPLESWSMTANGPSFLAMNLDSLSKELLRTIQDRLHYTCGHPMACWPLVFAFVSWFGTRQQMPALLSSVAEAHPCTVLTSIFPAFQRYPGMRLSRLCQT